MRVEKNGFTLHLDGTWMEISNRYGVLEYGDVAVDDCDVPEGFAERKMDNFIKTHSVKELDTTTCIKKVAIDPEMRRYVQLQAVFQIESGRWMVQKYDDEFVYIGEILTGCKYRDEVNDWMHSNYQIKRGLMAEVYRSSLGDCTNDGISSTRRELYILATEKYPFEPSDLRDCVCIEHREIFGRKYVNARPLYFPRRWYMAGGNFLYTSDSRFRDITGISYPVSIHDRYEGR